MADTTRTAHRGEPALAIDHAAGTDDATAASPDGAAAVWNVRLRGELDVSTAGQLEAVLDEVEDQGARMVILDLRDVTFLDSSGLRSIVRAQHRLASDRRSLLVDGLSPAARRVLEITGLLEGLSAPAADAD